MSTPAWLDRHLNMACDVYLRQPAGTDEYNNVIYAESAAIASRCFIQPVSQDEIQDGRAEIGQYMLHLPADIVGVIDGFARVEVDTVIGVVSFEAGASPAVYVSLTSSGPHHVEIVVNRSTA